MAGDLHHAEVTGAPKAVGRASSSNRLRVPNPRARIAPTPDLTPPAESSATGAGGIPLIGSFGGTTPNAPAAAPPDAIPLPWLIGGVVVGVLLIVWFVFRR